MLQIEQALAVEQPVEVTQLDRTKLQAEIQNPLTVIQSDGNLLNVKVDNFPAQDVFSNTYHYAALTHGTRAVIWTPIASYKAHAVSMTVSAPQAGNLILYDRNPAGPIDTTIMRLDFNLKQTVPFGFGTDMDLLWDHPYAGEWTQDAGTGSICYVTIIGHEHSPAAFPP